MAVLDWHPKRVVGHYAGLQARAWHGSVTLNPAMNCQLPHGIEGKVLHPAPASAKHLLAFFELQGGLSDRVLTLAFSRSSRLWALWCAGQHERSRGIGQEQNTPLVERPTSLETMPRIEALIASMSDTTNSV